MRLLFRQLFDARSSTYTYLLADPDRRVAVLIDPVLEQVQRDRALLAELDLQLAFTLETHVHADHVTGAWRLKNLCGSQIGVAAAAGASGADRLLSHGDRVELGSRHLEVRATPGHTGGCLTYVVDDHRAAFTGDCLLIRGCGRTDFQQGSAPTMYRSVHEQIFSLPDDCQLWPAHDYQGRTVTTVAEERRLNPRLGGDRSVADFVGYMDNLGLPHPKQIDVAVPANLECGRVDIDTASEPEWARLSYTYAGVWEIEPEALDEIRGEVTVVDVREPGEWVGELGRIPGSRNIPLSELAEHVGELPADRPVVTVCRSGGRSAQATVVLARAGIARVANLAGGMIRWRAQRLPVDGERREIGAGEPG